MIPQIWTLDPKPIISWGIQNQYHRLFPNLLFMLDPNLWWTHHCYTPNIFEPNRVSFTQLCVDVHRPEPDEPKSVM